MATFGALINTNVLGYMATGGGQFYFVGGDFPGGTITNLYFYGRNRASTAAFNDFDFAIYSGGTASGPNGATLIWNSKRYAAVNIGNTLEWKTAVDGSNAAPNVECAAGYVWVILRSADGLDIQTVDGADEGDFDAQAATYKYVNADGDPGDTWPTTFGSNGTSHFDTMKTYLEYTATAAVTTGRGLLLGVG